MWRNLFGCFKETSIPVEGEQGGAAAGHRRINGAGVVEGLLDFREAGIFREDGGFEIVHYKTFPILDGKPERVPQRDFGDIWDDAAVGVGRGYGDALRLEDFPAAGAEHGAVVDEEGAVAAEAGGERGELRVGERQAGELRDHPQGEGRVRAASAEAGAHGRGLLQVDLHRRQLVLLRQQAVRPGRQVLQRVPVHPFLAGEGDHQLPVGRDALRELRPGIRLLEMGRRAAVVVAGDDFQRVVEAVAGNEEGVQVVVAVGAAAQDPQAHVQLDVRVRYHTRKDSKLFHSNGREIAVEREVRVDAVLLEAVRRSVAARQGEEKAPAAEQGAAAGDEEAARPFRHAAVAPADAEEVAPSVGHGPSHPFPVGQHVRDGFSGKGGEGLPAGRLQEEPFRSCGLGADEGHDILLPGREPAPEADFPAVERQPGFLPVHFQDQAAGFRQHAGDFPAREKDVQRPFRGREGLIPFRIPHHMVLLAPFRRQAADVEDVFPEFRQGAACRAGRVRTAQDGPRLAPVQGASVDPVGEAAPVPVLAQGVDPVLPDQEAPDRLPALEPEQFRPVTGEDGLGVRGPVGVQVSARVPVHVRVHACARGLAPDHLAVPVQVDPDLAVHGAGVQVPREPVREADGREPDVFLRRARVRAGGVRPPAGAGFVGASGGAGKQRVPDAGRRKEG